MAEPARVTPAASPAQRMMALFRGFMGAHGTHGAPTPKPDGLKLEIRGSARTIRDPVTEQLWEQHLRGERALGIITIREDNCCSWASIDVDKYPMVHGDLVRELQALGAPVIVCKSKSGGAHIYMFFSEPVPAVEVIAKMRELAAVLGHGDSEIYPKQDSVLIDRGDLGNWMSMPYLGGDKTQKYAVRDDGRGMTLEQFLTAAEATRVSLARFRSLGFHKQNQAMSAGPPCLEHLSTIKIRAGSQNNGLFNFGVLARKMAPDSWEALLERWNHEFLDPPAGNDGVQSVIRSLRKREYSYKCGDQPIVQHCNMALCRTRQHGIGAATAARIIESISVLETDPPLFFVHMRSGGTVECDTNVILEPRAFQRAALSQTRQVLPLYSLEVWLRQVQVCMESATSIEVPREVGTTGHFEELLERFCTDRHAALERDELILGKPWLDEATGRVWFRLVDLQESLERSRFRELTRAQMVTRLRQMGGGTHFFNIKGKGVNCWFVPADKLTWQSSGVPAPATEEAPL